MEPEGMSAPSPKRHEYDDLQANELARWPGVSWSRQVRSKHYALVLTFDGVSRFVIYPSSPGDNQRGGLNHLRDIRQTLAAMGATRMAEPKSQQTRRTRNRTEPARVVIVERATGGPRRDPWAALASLEIPERPPTVEPPPAPPQEPWWRRVLAGIVGAGR
jgi:hypothetical protein